MSGPNGQVIALADRIEDEILNNKIFNGYIDKLQFLISSREDSDLKGLHEKLNAVGRADQIKGADRNLLLFEQVLEKYTHYQSAQTLFARFLMRILIVFENDIMPPGLRLSRQSVDEIIETKIIHPTISDLDAIAGRADLFLDESEIFGMINWLADRCHIRWQAC